MEKKYCVLFYNDAELKKSDAGCRWVKRTLLLLQRALVDFILERFRRGTLTVDLVVPEGAPLILESLPVLAHTQLIAGAVRIDSQRLEHIRKLNDALIDLRRTLSSGRLDHVGLLDSLLRALAGARWPDPNLASVVREIIGEIELRRLRVLKRYQREVAADSSLAESFRLFDPRAF